MPLQRFVEWCRSRLQALAPPPIRPVTEPVPPQLDEAEPHKRGQLVVTVPLSVRTLETESSWNGLQSIMSGEGAGDVSSALINQLRAAGAKSAIIEADYLDRDYSAEYSAFYSKLFSRYRRQTRRLHFFRTPLRADLPPLELREELQKISKQTGDYLGFIVLRPVRDAPVGRTVLATVDPHSAGEVIRHVRSEFKTHLLGVDLSVEGLPFVQQDNRVSACAQTSIWVCGRHFENRHGGPWKSTVDITADATNPTDGMLAGSLPAGAEVLHDDHIIRALAAMGRQPFAYIKDGERTQSPSWPKSVEPAAVLARYVCSGIPVILGLSQWKEGQSSGHTVVVHGCVFDPDAKVGNGDKKDWSKFVSHFLVHDDQLGPNLRMAVGKNGNHGQTPYNLAEHASSIIVPLPGKVFVTAETVEKCAWKHIVDYAARWSSLKQKYANLIVGSGDLGDRVVAAIKGKEVVARTTLTFGWKYKRRILEGAASPVVKEKVAVTPLPRMVWVTEFGTTAELRKPAKDQLIFAHCVVDATSTGAIRIPLIVHAPGFLWTNSPVEPVDYDKIATLMFGIPNDTTYTPRCCR